MTEPSPLSVAQMEAAYDLLADAIDRAGPHAEVFLAKALFILASRHVAPETFSAALENALRDL